MSGRKRDKTFNGRFREKKEVYKKKRNLGHRPKGSGIKKKIQHMKRQDRSEFGHITKDTLKYIEKHEERSL